MKISAVLGLIAAIIAVLIIGGGIIPEEEAHILKQKGISEIFGPGSRTEDIATFIRKNVGKQASGN